MNSTFSLHLLNTSWSTSTNDSFTVRDMFFELNSVKLPPLLSGNNSSRSPIFRKSGSASDNKKTSVLLQYRWIFFNCYYCCCYITLIAGNIIFIMGSHI